MPVPSPFTPRRLAAAALVVLTAAVASTTVDAAATGNATAAAANLPARADSIRAQQWQLDLLDARAAWRHATGAGVTVAVVDSGVDSTHVDLRGQVRPGLDLVDRRRDGRYDAVGHGTTVAGLIAGRADDRRGVVGLAPDAEILPVRVLDASNRYDDAAVVARGVRWAVDQGAQVINVSLGGPGDNDALADALTYAFDNDVVVVACTGNLTPSTGADVWFPARVPGVVAVAGLDQPPTRRWPKSVSGPESVLSAPAAGLVGARPGGYWTVQGTSFATPLVSATAALIRSRWPGMSAASVVNQMIRTSRDIGPAGRDDAYGFGVVDPVAALTWSGEPVAANPLRSSAAVAQAPRRAAAPRQSAARPTPAAAAAPQAAAFGATPAAPADLAAASVDRPADNNRWWWPMAGWMVVALAVAALAIRSTRRGATDRATGPPAH
ncbi:type VII secretion-associated serine protease mycosin [Pilimelia columellifera]|uniref:Peptidase S8/S53 domain-containing protein n=1 Tax=Pilimelia columellifera subsp. columellifera TaxID=706583 RepID=A0ABP6AMK2_9ACTN